MRMVWWIVGETYFKCWFNMAVWLHREPRWESAARSGTEEFGGGEIRSGSQAPGLRYAMMLDTVLGLDVRGDDARATRTPQGRHGWGGRGEVHGWSLRQSSGRWMEGRGGAFWYEVPH